MIKVKRSEFAAFMNTANSAATSPTWSRMGKGFTSQTVSYNAVTTSETYIHEDNATNTIDSYAPTMDAPLTAFAGEPIFDFVDRIRQERATGVDAETDVLLIYIYDNTGDAYEAEKQRVSIQIDDFGGEGGGSTVLNFTINFVGDPERGTVTIADGVPTFTAN